MNSYAKFALLLASAATLAANTACERVIGKTLAKQEPIRLVRVTKVAPSATQNETSFAGDVRARYETALSFRVGGKIAARNVEVGSLIERGQVLASLDPKDLQLGVQAQQAELNAARSELSLAQADYSRFKELLSKKFISQADFDRREAALKSAQQRVAAANAQFRQARNQADYARLVADHSGVVTAISAEIGQVVAPGQPVVRVARLEEKEIIISVPEQKVELVRAAREFEVSLWAQPGKTFKGALRELAPAGDPATRTFTAKISVLDADSMLRLGMTSKVTLGQKGAQSAVLLPLAALYTKTDQPSVWVVDPQSSRVRQVAVQTGGVIENQIIITAGLKPDDIVVTAGANLLIPNQQVRVSEAES